MELYVAKYAPFDAPETVAEDRVIAVNERSALQQIVSKGVPISVGKVSRMQTAKASRDYKQQFLLALLFNVQSGLSASRALEEVIQAEDGALRTQMDRALTVIYSGGTFSDGLEAMQMFDKATMAIVRAGEQVGAMAQALQSAVEHYKKAGASAKLLIGSLVALSVDIVFSVISVFSVQYQLLPSIAEQGITAEDPAVVENFNSSLHMAYIINGTMMWATIAVLLAVIGVAVIYPNKKAVALRTWVDDKVGRIPLLKDVLAHTAIANTFAVCATLLKGGVRLTPAIEIVRNATMSPSVDRYWATALKRIESGETVADALRSPLLERAETLIINAHRDAEQLAEAMSNISLRRDDMAARANKRFGIAAFVGTLIYSGASVLVALWVSYLQYQSMMAGMMSIGG